MALPQAGPDQLSSASVRYQSFVAGPFINWLLFYIKFSFMCIVMVADTALNSQPAASPVRWAQLLTTELC